MKKQITISEMDDWDTERFNYVVFVTDEEEKKIRQKCEKYGNRGLLVKQTNYTDENIKELNSHYDNSFMDFIAPYKIKEGVIENWHKFGKCFHRGSGLTKLKSLEEN